MYITSSMTISEIQRAFNIAFPYLSVELPEGVGDKNCSVHSCKVTGEMTVTKVEAMFDKALGCESKILRQTGTVWVATERTKEWTLTRQNERGKEFSATLHTSSGQQNKTNV